MLNSLLTAGKKNHMYLWKNCKTSYIALDPNLWWIIRRYFESSYLEVFRTLLIQLISIQLREVQIRLGFKNRAMAGSGKDSLIDFRWYSLSKLIRSTELVINWLYH